MLGRVRRALVVRLLEAVGRGRRGGRGGDRHDALVGELVDLVARARADFEDLVRQHGRDVEEMLHRQAERVIAAVHEAEMRERRDIRATGAVVLVLGPVPDPHTNVPICLSDHLASAAACAPDRARAVSDPGMSTEAAATAAGGGHYADLTSLFCTATRCPLIVGNQLVYRDDNHLTVGYAQWLAPVLAAEVDRAVSGP